MNRIFLVGVGAALGGVARYLVSGAVQQAAGPALPLGTLAVNVTGSFLAGVVMGSLDTRLALSPEARVFLTAGFLGAFTTFSTFAYETDALLTSGRLLWAASSTAANVGLSVGAIALGRAAAGVLFG